jgi:hypothetical protein
MFAQQMGVAALPWLTLFRAARRGVPLRPRPTGGLIGLAALSSAIAASLFSAPGYAFAWELGMVTVFVLL